MREDTYESPQVEVIEIEIEDTVLGTSGDQLKDFTEGGSAW